jgi:hypothetical protein
MQPHHFWAIGKQIKGTICDFPARLLTPDERALVAEWLASAGDIVDAYVSNRRVDDPALYRRIVIVLKPESRPAHLVHAPPVGTSGLYFRWADEQRSSGFVPFGLH